MYALWWNRCKRFTCVFIQFILTQLLKPMFGTIRSASSPKGRFVRCLLTKSGKCPAYGMTMLLYFAMQTLIP